MPNNRIYTTLDEQTDAQAWARLQRQFRLAAQRKQTYTQTRGEIDTSQELPASVATR